MKAVKNRYIDLSNIPRKGKFIDWKNSIGVDIKFAYDDVEGVLEVVEYNKKTSQVKIRYNNKCFHIGIGSLAKCGLGIIIGKKTKEFKVEKGEHFSDVNRDILIINREYRSNHHQNKKYYQYVCSKCNYHGWVEEVNLLNGCGCSCCRGLTAVYGINSIHDTAPWMIDLGVDKEEAKKLTRSSEKKIKCICPHCGEVVIRTTSNVYQNRSIGCICSDGKSYPEKFVYSMLKQLGIEFETQLSKTTFRWCDKYRYDFYIPSLNMIIETHGIQHYEESTGIFKELYVEQKNDKLKKELSLSNGIVHYIELDCRISNLDWVKNSILKSELNELFDLDIDWLKCESYALCNLVKEVCDYWNNKQEWETTVVLAKVFNMSVGAIRTYLRKANELGWCYYVPKEEKMKIGSKLGKLSGKKVEIFKDGISLGIFESVTELERQSEGLFGVKLLRGNISSVCLGKRKIHKDYTFNYVENKNNNGVE